MTIGTTPNITQRLLEVLGLSGQHVTSIVIRVELNSPVMVDVTRLVGFDEFEQAISEFTPYVLVPKDET